MSLYNILSDLEDRLEMRIRSLERRMCTLEDRVGDIDDPEYLASAVELGLSTKFVQKDSGADRSKG